MKVFIVLLSIIHLNKNSCYFIVYSLFKYICTNSFSIFIYLYDIVSSHGKCSVLHLHLYSKTQHTTETSSFTY